MPQPPALLQLARAQRLAQDQLARAMALQLAASYRQLITGTQRRSATEQWLAMMVPLIQAFRARSTGLAGVFYQRSHALVLPDAPLNLAAVDDDDVPDEAIETSLYVTGVVELFQKLEAGKPLETALTEAVTAAEGAAARHVLEGGRSYTRNAVIQDTLAVGFYRQTKGDPCSFCAVLASRGAVYKEDSFQDSDPQFRDDPEMPSTEKVHDHCHCTLQPIWTRTSNDPRDDGGSNAHAFGDLWDRAVRDPVTGRRIHSGKDALNAFRRAYEAQMRERTA